MHQLGTLEYVDAAAHFGGGKLKTHWHGQALGKARRLVSLAVAIGVFDDKDVVVAVFTRLQLRVRGDTGHPEAAPLVPADLDGTDHAEFFVSEQTDVEACA